MEIAALAYDMPGSAFMIARREENNVDDSRQSVKDSGDTISISQEARERLRVQETDKSGGEAGEEQTLNADEKSSGNSQDGSLTAPTKTQEAVQDKSLAQQVKDATADQIRNAKKELNAAQQRLSQAVSQNGGKTEPGDMRDQSLAFPEPAAVTEEASPRPLQGNPSPQGAEEIKAIQSEVTILQGKLVTLLQRQQEESKTSAEVIGGLGERVDVGEG